MVSLPFALLAVFAARFGNGGGMLSHGKSMKRRLGLKFEKGADGFAPGKGDVCKSGAPIPSLGEDTANYFRGESPESVSQLECGSGKFKRRFFNRSAKGTLVCRGLFCGLELSERGKVAAEAG